MEVISMDVLKKILGDKYSKNMRVCPNCGSDKLIKVGMNKMREEETYKCNSCGKNHKINLLD